MNATSQTTSPPFTRLAPAHGSSPAREQARGRGPLAPHRVALIAILGLSALLNIYELSRNGWANNFYSAGVRSMLLSPHNFLFISFDPGGLISLDKPPLAIWVMAASAKVFGFTPMSVLLPEAIAGVLCVGVLYLAMAKPFGRLAALLGALALAVFPAFVAINRDNNPDALLILLMTISCWSAIKAIDSGRLRGIVLCGIFVGLAFETKTLAAYLVIPGIALGYLVCAPGTLAARIGKLLIAGVAMVAVSLAWLLFVDATPASHRPYVGSSTDNSEIGLTFGYNGLGRIGGQKGGPGAIPLGSGANAPLPPKLAFEMATEEHQEATELSHAAFGSLLLAGRRLFVTEQSIEQIVGPPGHPKPQPPPEYLPNGRASKPTPFGKPPGPLRLLEEALGAQDGWLLPFSLGGAIALLALLGSSWRGSFTSRNGSGAHGRRDPRLAGLLVLGGWFAVEAVVLSLASGIVHPYYTSALGPGASAMAGAGVIAFATLVRRDRRWALPLTLTVLASVAAEIALLDRSEYMQWLLPILVVCGIASVVVTVLARDWARWSLTALLGVLLLAPTGFAAATWGAPVEGTFPVAGPWGAPGYGGVGVEPKEVPEYKHILRYVQRHHPTRRFSLLTVSSVTAAPFILWGSNAAALAGYSGTDPAVSAGGLANLVEHHEARYVLLGGPYASRGGNGATAGTLAACRFIPSHLWGGIHNNLYSLVLYDCAGRAKELWAYQNAPR
jgi:4-amino-4-deoxy-L-arabinose transferase-like glycosyltransferase